MIKKKLIILLIFLVIFLLGCTQDTSDDSVSIIKIKENDKNNNVAPSNPVKVELQLSKAPLLGETVLLNTTVTVYQNDAKNVTINIDLPEGFIFVNGDLSWEGDIIIPNKTFPPFNESNSQAKTSFSLVSYIKAVEEGNWTIIGALSDNHLVGIELPPEFQPYADLKPTGKLYVSVSETESNVSKTPFPEPVEPCVDTYIDGELVQCTTAEPTGDFIETQLP